LNFYKCNKASKYIFREFITIIVRSSYLRHPSLFGVSSSPEEIVIFPHSVSFLKDLYSLQDALPNFPFVKRTINKFVAIRTIKVFLI